MPQLVNPRPGCRGPLVITMMVTCVLANGFSWRSLNFLCRCCD
jgi:hypothetical protein